VNGVGCEGGDETLMKQKVGFEFRVSGFGRGLHIDEAEGGEAAESAAGSVGCRVKGVGCRAQSVWCGVNGVG